MNTLLIIAVILFAGGAIRGYKTGFIKEAATAVRLLFALAILICIFRAAGGYLDHDAARSIGAIIAIGILSMMYKMINFAIAALEIIGKLPLLKNLDRATGALLGLLEAFFLIWALVSVLPLLGIPAIFPPIVENLLKKV